MHGAGDLGQQMLAGKEPMRTFIDKLRLFTALPMEMQSKIVMDDFHRLVNKYVGIFTSNA